MIEIKNKEKLLKNKIIKGLDFYMQLLAVILLGMGGIFYSILIIMSLSDSKPDYGQCKMTDFVNNKFEFTCKNDLKIIKNFNDLTFGEWNTFRDKNHCRLVKIDKTVSKNKNNWSCDNNLNINNDFYE